MDNRGPRLTPKQLAFLEVRRKHLGRERQAAERLKRDTIPVVCADCMDVLVEDSGLNKIVMCRNCWERRRISGCTRSRAEGVRVDPGGVDAGEVATGKVREEHVRWRLK